MYLEMHIREHGDECCARKQIYDDGEIVFDGLITYTDVVSDKQTSNMYDSPLGYEFILNNEKIPVPGEYTYGCIPANCINKKAEIFINNCKPNAKERGQNIFNVPDFVLNKEEDWCIAYVGCQFNKFCVRQDGTTLVYNKYNKLIAKIIKSTEMEEKIIFDANTAKIIHKSIQTLKSDRFVFDEFFYYGPYQIRIIYIVVLNAHTSTTRVITKDGVDIFCCVVDKNDDALENIFENIFADIMTDDDKLYLKFDGSKFPSMTDFYETKYSDAVQNVMMMYEEIWDEAIFLGRERTVVENIISADIKFNFEIRHTSLIREHGNIHGDAKRTVVTGRNDKGNINTIHQHNYDSRGHSKNRKLIDANNKYTVKSHSQKETYDGHVGYKAARTIDDQMCVVKLYVPGEAKVAWEPTRNKYRTNFATVIDIKIVTCVNDTFYYENDLLVEECPVCKDSFATHMSFPCHHKLCFNCWRDVLNKGNKCLMCSSKVVRIAKIDIDFNEYILEEIQNNDIVRQNNTVREAYSFIHTNKFVYRLGDSVIENNFDGDLDKTCVPGIHYHDNDDDVFKWFEYMDIPKKLQVTQQSPMQIGDALSDRVTDAICDGVETFDLQSLKKRNIPQSFNIQDNDSSSEEEYDPKKVPQIKPDKHKIE